MRRKVFDILVSVGGIVIAIVLVVAGTLQGLLLEAYGFGTFGIIALWAAVASFCFAFVILSLIVLGLYHARRTPPETQLFAVLQR